MIIPMPSEKKQGLSERIVPASLGFFITFFAISQIGDPYGYGLVCMLIMVIATAASLELHAILTRIGFSSSSRFFTWLCCFLPSFCVWQTNGSLEGWLVAMAAALLFPIAKAVSGMQPVNSWISFLFCFFYMGVPLALLQTSVLATTPHIAIERRLEMTLFLIAVKGMDLGGYFIGRYFGSHRLAPKISPKKTWEGFVGGVTFSTLAVASLAFFAFNFGLEKTIALSLVALILAIFAQGGDLFESYLKRLADVKDSGRLPGLGGVLDMIDSILPCVYVVWAFKALSLI